MIQQLEHPTILHTDDSINWRTTAQDHYAALGINVHSFSTNEEGLKAANEVLGLPDKYDAAVVDYETHTAMKGVDLISELLRSKACGEVLVLSSSTSRSILKDELASWEIAVDLVQIFDKAFETRISALYVAAKIFHPKEAEGLTRRKLIEWMGFRLDSYGEIRRDDLHNFGDKESDVWNKVTGKEMSLLDIARIGSGSIEGGASSSGGIES